MRMKFRQTAACLLTALLGITALPYSSVPVQADGQTVTFSSFPAAVNDGEPIRGVDISSILSVEEAGVVFHDDAYQEADIFQVLADHGVNYIRVRIWNQPNDGNGHSYGGGNNDVQTAAEIGRRAAKYGMKLLVDFHYSDFWADPEKQRVPKAWNGYTLAEKGSAIYYYTLESLQTIREAGADIGMVQIGNETNSHLCGETDMYSICQMFTAGCNAVRDFDSNILRVLHFADPSSGQYAWYAKVLDECSVDYDVFATSYYPYWHGTVQNLTTVLKEIADTYGKYVMVAETAYPYTDEDGDRFANVVSSGSAGTTFRYDISVEGQAQCLTEVFQAMADVGGKGLGVFYWEPAWLGKADISWNEQKELWEQHGSGWATSYAVDYDSSVTQAGGSSYDNQALFDFWGYTLDSLDVFTRIYPQTYLYRSADDAELADGIYLVRNQNSSLYLNADAQGNVIQAETGAQWHLQKSADGTYTLTSTSDGGSLTVTDVQDGKSSVRLGEGSAFTIVEKSGSLYFLTADSGRTKGLDIFDSSTDSGAWLTYSKMLLQDSQQFALTLVQADPTEPETESATVPETQPVTEPETRPVTELETPEITTESIRSERPAGDIHPDGTVNLSDLMCLQKYLLGSEPFTDGEQFQSADLNADGEVDVYDLALLKRRIFPKKT